MQNNSISFLAFRRFTRYESIAVLALLMLLFFASALQCSAEGFLTVDGERVLDGSKNPIVLKGFNMEFKHFKSVLGEPDIKRIASSGANSIRLALDYRDLENAPYQYNENNFLLLDSIIRWCERHSVYVVLDLHLAPGIQNPHDFVVHRQKVYEFWERKEYQERFYSLWSEIAKRYADRKTVAGYDLLNEGVPPTIDQYLNVIRKAAEKIRLSDRNHILVVEEAIMHDGKKELVLIDDKNTIYSIHFFYPPQFSFYITTENRKIIKYPGEIVAVGEKISEKRLRLDSWNSGWKKISMNAEPPEGAELFKVEISSKVGKGAVWLDDVSLESGGNVMDLPAPLVSNNSFETDYPGLNWNISGSCVKVAEGISHTGKRSLVFNGCVNKARAESSPIAVNHRAYSLSAWYRAEDSNGENYISLAWHKKTVVGHIDKNELAERLEYAAGFKSRFKVPVYVGEFTCHANPSKESITRYLTDILDIFDMKGFHWSFWEYYSEYPGIGLYAGNPLYLTNPEGLNAVRMNMSREIFFNPKKCRHRSKICLTR